ncbi:MULTISPECIES: 4-phosphoerythronate dehydrogenase [Halomonadaceae]|uniref:4-phosphoerythronate dehydrogenase n=1 Tax=Halomonadaceae TaxID=28256 RepID=UPI0015832B66|nr:MULTISPECIES: 4-phosphoerythronate dehydrogenase [Halomonas]MDI4636677.1 4-phosphoerythronate dehydrogenase [Halomonas sp. BMC7]NUJ61042.1 4-phosphoerythronate dehydrogenase [Halomonas taeanensis]
MRLLIDSLIPKAEACFAELGSITRRPGREIDAQAVRDAEAEVLVVRSITRVDEALLEDSRLRFVGTCTIGTDHLDQAALEAQGIGFANAPGCNAEAVVDYVLSSLLTLAEREGTELDQRRIGIVGAGNVGGRLYRRLTALGLDCRVCDPPRAEQEAEKAADREAKNTADHDAGVEQRPTFDDLDTLIETCDVLCLHTPLVRDGEHRTHHLLDEARIAALEPGTWLLNAGRGDCLDGQALLARLAASSDLRTVLDVFEDEPAIDEALWRLADIATPHIAGHSLDGKLRGTHQVYRAAMEYFGLPVRVAFADLAPATSLPSLTLDAGLLPWEALRLCVRACYDVRRDHDGLIRYQREKGLKAGFDAYRSEYPLRREFSTLRVRLRPAAASLEPLLAAAGFAVEVES